MDNKELIYDNYKESFALSKKAQSDRDRFFIILVVLIAILFMLFIDPNTTGTILNGFIKEKLKVDIAYSVYIIQSLVWFLLLYFTMRYYQKVIYIERQYYYLHNIESIMSKEISSTFNREGGNYLEQYPLFSDFIDLIYKWIFPILYIAIITIKILSEWKVYNNLMNILLNSLLALLIISMTTLYFIFLHPCLIKRKTDKTNNSN